MRPRFIGRTRNKSGSLSATCSRRYHEFCADRSSTSPRSRSGGGAFSQRWPKPRTRPWAGCQRANGRRRSATPCRRSTASHRPRSHLGPRPRSHRGPPHDVRRNESQVRPAGHNKGVKGEWKSLLDTPRRFFGVALPGPRRTRDRHPRDLLCCSHRLRRHDRRLDVIPDRGTNQHGGRSQRSQPRPCSKERTEARARESPRDQDERRDRRLRVACGTPASTLRPATEL